MEYLCRIWGRRVPQIEATEADRARLVDLYDGEMAYLDVQMGRLLAVLDSLATHRPSVLAFTADHGESLTEHDYLFDHGQYLFQPGIWIPLILRGDPLKHVPGLVVSQQVENMDVLPTLLAAAGIPIPANVEGRDLGPLCRGEDDETPRLSFGESCRQWEVEKMFPGTYPNLNKAQSVLAYPWKFILTPYLGKKELYHLERDPGELRNVATDHSDRVDAYTEQLDLWRSGRTRESGSIDLENLEKIRALGYVE
jgi:arylsulfatase A-like enzyme